MESVVWFCLESFQKSHGLKQGGGRLCPDSPELSRAAGALGPVSRKAWQNCHYVVNVVCEYHLSRLMIGDEASATL